MKMILHLRAGNWQISKISIYDNHEEKYFKESWAWSWTPAHDLYETDETAESCTEIIKSKYKDWVAWIDGAEDRHAEAEARKLAKTEAKKVAFAYGLGQRDEKRALNRSANTNKVDMPPEYKLEGEGEDLGA